MRSLRLTILPLLVAASLAAQAPPAPSATTSPSQSVSPRRGVFFDVAALIDDRQRFGIEPMVFGRWAVGLIATHTRTVSGPEVQTIAYGGLSGPAVPTTMCPVQGCPFPSPGSASSYNAWSLDLAVRFYPAALSFNDPRRRFMIYLGEFIGYHQRTLQQQYYGPVPLAQPANILPCTVAVPATRDSLVPMPPLPPGCYPPVPYPTTSTRRLTGWEPGAEIGMRMVPLDPVFIDVGGWFKLVTLDDPMQRIRPGSVDSRLVVAVGIGW